MHARFPLYLLPFLFIPGNCPLKRGVGEWVVFPLPLLCAWFVTYGINTACPQDQLVKAEATSTAPPPTVCYFKTIETIGYASKCVLHQPVPPQHMPNPPAHLQGNLAVSNTLGLPTIVPEAVPQENVSAPPDPPGPPRGTPEVPPNPLLGYPCAMLHFWPSSELDGLQSFSSCGIT